MTRKTIEACFGRTMESQQGRITKMVSSIVLLIIPSNIEFNIRSLRQVITQDKLMIINYCYRRYFCQLLISPTLKICKQLHNMRKTPGIVCYSQTKKQRIKIKCALHLLRSTDRKG